MSNLDTLKELKEQAQDIVDKLNAMIIDEEGVVSNATPPAEIKEESADIFSPPPKKDLTPRRGKAPKSSSQKTMKKPAKKNLKPQRRR